MLLEKLLQEYAIPLETFTSKEYDLFDSFFEKRKIKKNTFLVREGEVENYSYFIDQGIFRCWVLDQKGVEQTFWFCKPGTFSMSNISFILNQSATFYVQAVMDCEVYRIDRAQVEQLYQAIPSLKAVFDHLTAILLNRLLERQVHMIKYSPEQYYVALVTSYGALFNFIPLKDIASFLGITPQALSRIRKRIF
ncbi:Crp/Fnr family transcriptional regulator [Myroides odoratus]|uniref:Crp/Fnr family transcriptional regulator n=1 Tax=Myroides odoratus TaxID=256 RepID=UPI003342B5EB